MRIRVLSSRPLGRVLDDAGARDGAPSPRRQRPSLALRVPSGPDHDKGALGVQLSTAHIDKGVYLPGFTVLISNALFHSAFVDASCVTPAALGGVAAASALWTQ